MNTTELFFKLTHKRMIREALSPGSWVHDSEIQKLPFYTFNAEGLDYLYQLPSSLIHTEEAKRIFLESIEVDDPMYEPFDLSILED